MNLVFSSQDLEYELRRQNSLELDKKGGVEKRGGGGRGSSYVGLRLASDELCGDRSPRKPSQDSTSDNNKVRDQGGFTGGLVVQIQVRLLFYLLPVLIGILSFLGL